MSSIITSLWANYTRVISICSPLCSLYHNPLVLWIKPPVQLYFIIKSHASGLTGKNQDPSLCRTFIFTPNLYRATFINFARSLPWEFQLQVLLEIANHTWLILSHAVKNFHRDAMSKRDFCWIFHRVIFLQERVCIKEFHANERNTLQPEVDVRNMHCVSLERFFSSFPSRWFRSPLPQRPVVFVYNYVNSLSTRNAFPFFLPFLSFSLRVHFFSLVIILVNRKSSQARILLSENAQEENNTSSDFRSDAATWRYEREFNQLGDCEQRLKIGAINFAHNARSFRLYDFVHHFVQLFE